MSRFRVIPSPLSSVKLRVLLVSALMIPLAAPSARGDETLRSAVVRRAAVSAGPAATARIVGPHGERAAQMSASDITLRDREVLTLSSPVAAQVVHAGAATRWVLPYRILTPAPAGSSPANSAPRQLRVIAAMQGGGLRFRAAAGGFVGTLLVGLEDSESPQTTSKLPVPVRVRLIADADVVRPGELLLDQTNVASFQPVEIQQIEARDSLRVHIRPDFDPDGTEIWLPVQRSAVVLKSSPRRVQGFGLEVVRVTGELPPGIRPDGRVVFTSTLGTPEPGETVTGNGVATTLIRSRGVGRTRVTADLAPFQSGTLDIDFVWPVAFATAALIGGLLGSLVEALRGASRKASPKWLAYLTSGTIVGIIVAAAYAAGINLVPAALTVGTTVSEAAVFVIGALGGALGLPWLKSLVPGFREQLESAEGS